MRKIIPFPAIHLIDGEYRHGLKAFPDLASLEASLSEVDRWRALWWQEQRQEWLDTRKRRRGSAARAGGAA
jgi:hypothetical protein